MRAAGGFSKTSERNNRLRFETFSNRTSRFPASGFPTSFTARHTTGT